MSPSPDPPSVRGTVLYAILGVVPALTLFTQLVVFVPRMKKTFDEFGLQVPWLTKVVLGLGTWAHTYWWMLTPVLLLMLGLAVGGLVWLRHGLRYRATLLVALVLIPVIVANVIVAFALILPLEKLQEGLAK